MPQVGGRHRVVLSAPTRHQRQRLRRSLGTLAQLTVAPATLQRYVIAVERFTAFLDARGTPYPRALRRLDALLSEYIESLWMDGDPKSWAANALSGIQHFIPSSKHHLPSQLEALYNLGTPGDAYPGSSISSIACFCLGSLLQRAPMVFHHVIVTFGIPYFNAHWGALCNKVPRCSC